MANKTVRVNVYKSGGEWFEARWIDGKYDGSDAIDIDCDASEADVIALVAEAYPGATVARVPDAV